MYESSYSGSYLASLAQALRASTAPAWCIFDNTALGAAADNALELRELLAGPPAPA